MSKQEPLSRTPSFQAPTAPHTNFDDAPRKSNGALLKDASPSLVTKPRELPHPPAKPQTLADTSPSAAIPLARSGTLSWQQRPSSRGPAGPRSRPLSMLASESNAKGLPRASAEPTTDMDGLKSRDQIAQSLGSRDPSWFKQTQDRGAGSAAFRKNQVEDALDTTSSTGSMRLPGMSRESTAEPDSKSPPLESANSDSTSRDGSIWSNPKSHQFSNFASLSSSSSMRSPLPKLDSQRFEPPASDTTSTSGADDNSLSGRALAMSPSQGRMSPERTDRPASPTKGLGGFVQSAMLKRSDSVNKRWSAQVGPGLSRGNSTASNLSGYGGSRLTMGGITPLMESRPNSSSRESSPKPNSRPASSHSDATITQRPGQENRTGKSTFLANSASASRFDESLSDSLPGETKSPPEALMSPPASPSKRWSPTKSSWLENALNKSDSPKIRSPAPQQPAWMSEISRAKQQRGSVDLGKGGSNFKEVAIGGLVRSPPPGAGYKPPTIGGLPSGFSAGVASKSRTGSLDDGAQQRNSPDTVAPNGKGSAMKGPPSPGESLDHNRISRVKPDTAGTAKPTESSVGSRSTPPPNSSAISPKAAKPKPETPPQKDFKSPLKPRQTSGEQRPKEETEFKNVFGNLKRTQTKNYVAPDELKDTIMRGKTGLVQTGGPKKTERKDEFRESILQKKQGMVLPSASTRITSASSKINDQSTPEAIAKRKALIRSESTQSVDIVKEEKQASKPEALAKLAHLRDKPKSTSPETQNTASGTSHDPEPKGGIGGNFASSLAGMLQRGPSPMASKPTMAENLSEKLDGSVSEPAKESAAPSEGPQLTHVTKTRARGPRRRLPTANKQEETLSPTGNALTPRRLRENIPSTASQSHVAAQLPTSPASPINNSKPEPRPLSNITNSNNNNRKSSQPQSPRKPSSQIAAPPNVRPSSPVLHVANKEVNPKSAVYVNQKPVTTQQDENFRPPSSITSAGFPSAQTERPQAQNSQAAPSMPHERREPRAHGENASLPSVKGAAAVWGQADKSPQSSRARSPVKLPTRKDEEAAMTKAGLRPKEPVDLPEGTPVKKSQQLVDPGELSNAPSPKSPPLPKKKPFSVTNKVASASTQASVTPQKPTPLARSLDVGDFFADIFDEPASFNSKMNIDTQAVIDSRSSVQSNPKIKTLRKQIFEISDNGKSIPVPSHAEHVLYDESMYLCTHVFGTLTGQRTTEVYLWCGDGVPSAIVEDAQLFAKKFAKDNNGKLVVLRQGKETANFFQALGGIVITRRGSASRTDASTGSGATYILCGRQHVGQIAFDEVDFSARSLCKGFPYIVSAPGGKLYLWKGSGSGADELGCARLIGMDLGLTGEIEEIDEGREPDVFWQSFPDRPQDSITAEPNSGQHWHLKSACEKYTTRLFNIGTPRPKSGSGPIQGAMQWVRRGSAPASEATTSSTAQIKEVMPFAQSDLSDDGVFVLDAFFEIFV